MSRFSEQVPKSNVEFELLPLFHTCDGYDAGEHIKNSAIKTSDVCEVFKEKLTYLFYGRPAYKYSLPEGSTENLEFYACSFVFRAEKIEDVKRIFPFDTGALHHGFLKNFINPKADVAKFEVEPDVRRIADIVLRFHGGNENYLKRNTKSGQFDPLDFESLAFERMHNAQSWDKTDERRVTIEVQAGDVVDLTGSTLEALILPRGMVSSQHVQRIVEATGADVIGYDIETWDPRYSFNEVMRVARQYLDGRDVDQ